MLTNEDTLRWLEELSAISARFREALAGVWCWDYVSEEGMARLDAAAGTPLARPTRDLPDSWKRADDAMNRLIEIGGPEWYLQIIDAPEASELGSAFEVWHSAWMVAVNEVPRADARPD